MADVIAPPAPQNGLLRRRNSISASVVAPAQLSLHNGRDASSSSSSYATTAASSATSSGSSQTDGDFELFSIKPVNYTSLKDLLPGGAAVNSPRPMTPGSHHGSAEILIRNRLVKQAAWAYLQPMSTSPDSSAGTFLRRLCLRFSGNAPVVALLDFVDRHILLPLTRTVDWLLRAIGLRSVR
nr:Formin-like protein [Ipomoea batatas]GMD44397.1 Formin-like protein [Ipomoea batatas]